jgi:hypothetical protein
VIAGRVELDIALIGSVREVPRYCSPAQALDIDAVVVWISSSAASAVMMITHYPRRQGRRYAAWPMQHIAATDNQELECSID